MKALLLLAAIAAPALAGQEQVFPLPLFKEGLYTRYSANAIPDGALSDALNVTIDQDVDGVVVARNGYAKYNTAAITDTKTVRGLWSFDASDGTKYMVAHSSASFYKTIGDGTWTAIAGANSFSLTKDFDCVQTIGKLFCANGDTVFSWDGTSTATVTGAPVGDLVGRFRNRLLMAGVSGSKARLRGSGELDANDWTLQIPGVSTTPFSIAFGGVDDGEDISCLMGAYQDVFIVGKRNSLWGLYGFGRSDFQVREISREVGCIENRSVREKNNCLYWMSLRGIEKFCGSYIERIGDPIRDKIDTIVATAGNARSALDTTQADFEQGNLLVSGPGAPISATISAGSIIPSSVTFVDNSTGNWVAGYYNLNIDTSGAGGSIIKLTSATVQDNFSNGVVAGRLAWADTGTTAFQIKTVAGSSWLNTGNGSNQSDLNHVINTSSITLSSGSWSFTWRYSNPDVGDAWSCSSPVTNNECFSFRFMKNAGGDYYELYMDDTASSFSKTLRLRKKVSGVTTGLTTYGASFSADTSYVFEVQRSTDGRMFILSNGVFVASTTADTSVTTPTKLEIAAYGQYIYGPPGNTDENYFTDIYVYQYSSSGTIRSRIFDTSLSTPTWGQFSSTFTTQQNIEGQAVFYTQVSTSPNNDMWDAKVASSDTIKIASAQKRYIQYEAGLSTYISTKTPTITAVALAASTTGYFISQCRNPSTQISSWGLFTCTQELNNGDLTYYISTGTTCDSVTRTTATWNAQGNNSPIGVSTSAYVAYRVLFEIDSATVTPTVWDCTINWNEGESRPPVASSVYNDRYYLAYTSSTASGSYNDHLLVLDRNDKWTLFSNHPCYSMSFYNRKLYCGSSTDAGQVWLLDQGTDDDGVAILSRMRTKAFNLGLPESRKKFKRLYLDLEPSPDPSQTITLTGRYTLERSTPTFSLGTVDLNEDPGSIMTSKFPFSLANPVTGRYIQLELESNRTNSPWRLFGGRLYYSPMDPE